MARACHTVGVARRLASTVIILALCVLGALFGAPAHAYAHADLQQEEPAAGAAVPTPPEVLRLRFSEPLDGSATRVEVLDADGNRVDRDDLSIGPPNDRLLTVSLGDLVDGVYTVRWWSLSQTDGHRWQGVYRFGIGRTPPPADGAPAALPSPVELAIQWGALLATAWVLGGLTFRLWALEPALAVAGAAPKTFARFSRVLTLAFGLLALTSIGELAASLGVFSNPPPVDVGGFGGIGKVGALAVLRLLLVPMIAYLAAPGGSTAMAVAFAVLLVLTRGQVSHAAGGGLGPVLVDTAHQVAADAWVGGAVAFAVVVPMLLRERPAAVRLVGARFGQLALAAAGLAIVSGVLSGWLLGVDPTQLLQSRYGESLAGKLGLVVLLLGAAFAVWRRRVGEETGGNRGGASPAPTSQVRARLAPPAPVSPRPRVGGRRVLGIALPVELTLGAAVLLAASALALLPPPGETSALPLDLVQPAGAQRQLRVHLTLDRVRVGDIQAEVRVADATGRSVGQAGVQIEASELAPFCGALDPAPGVTDAYAE
jgi:copper transport protein